MSNHYHLIASTPHANISQCMHQFMGRSSRRLTRAGNRINQTFAGRYYKSILGHPNYFLNAYKYNYRNPVNAGICNFVQDYPFSTLPMISGNALKTIPLIEDTTYNSDPVGTLKWLNTAPEKERLEAVRYGLKRTYFTYKKSTNTNKAIMGPNDLL